MKHFSLLSLISFFLLSCIGENFTCSESRYKVKNLLQDSVIVLYATSKYEFVKKDGTIIKPGETKMMCNNTYLCEDAGDNIKDGSAEGGFVATTNYVGDCHLIVFSMSGDTLGNFSSTSSIYNKENWDLSIDNKYNVDCILNLTKTLIDSATK